MHKQEWNQEVTDKRMCKMRKGKERKRLRYAKQRNKLLPDLRIRITVERFDCGELQTFIFELKKSGRIDRYLTYINGVLWNCCGLSGVLVELRKMIPRILSEE